MVYLLLSLILKIEILGLSLNELYSFKALDGIKIIINGSSILEIKKEFYLKFETFIYNQTNQRSYNIFYR